MPTIPARDDALTLLRRHVTSDYVLQHSLATEAILRALARRLGHDEDLWGHRRPAARPRHDEVGTDPKRHALRTVEILKPLDTPQELLDAIVAHNGDELGVPCRTPLDFAVTAGESVTGLVFAMAKVLPSKSVADVKASSVRKRIREARFAANVSRERVGQFAGLGLSEEEFLEISVAAMKEAGRMTSDV